MKYKRPKTIKATYLVNLVLLSVSIAIDDEFGLIASMIIFVVLICTVELLKAIHNSNAELKRSLREVTSKPGRINQEFANIDTCTIIKNNE